MRFSASERRDRRLWLVSALFSGLGVVISVYLTLVHYRQNLLLCGVTNGCHTVQQSKYAELLGIPVAILGLAMYLTLLTLAVARLRRPENGLTAGYASFGIALMGVFFSAYLTYVEIWVIDAICQWCVASAVIVSVIMITELLWIWRMLDPEPDS